MLFFFLGKRDQGHRCYVPGALHNPSPPFDNKGRQTGNANEPSKRGFLGGVLFNKLDVPSVFKNNLMLVVI